MDEKMRAEFEVWMHTFDFPPDLEGELFLDERYIDSPLYGKFYYFETDTQRCWAAWQASRAALVIELPKASRQVTWDDESMDVMWPCEVIEAIEAAGVRVKP